MAHFFKLPDGKMINLDAIAYIGTPIGSSENYPVYFLNDQEGYSFSLSEDEMQLLAEYVNIANPSNSSN